MVKHVRLVLLLNSQEFTHAKQDQDHGARPKSRYQDKKLLGYRKERRIVIRHDTQATNILDYFDKELRILEEH